MKQSCLARIISFNLGRGVIMDYSTLLQMQYLINVIFIVLGVLYFVVILMQDLKRAKKVSDMRRIYGMLILIFSSISYVLLLLNSSELIRLSIFLIVLSSLVLYASMNVVCERKWYTLAWGIFFLGLAGAFTTMTVTTYGFWYHLLVDFVLFSALIYLTTAFLLQKSSRVLITLLIGLLTTFNEIFLVHISWEGSFFLNFLSILVVGLFLSLYLSYRATSSTAAAVSLFSIILIFGINLSASSIILGRFDIFYYFLAIIYVGFALTSGTVYFLSDYLKNKRNPSLYFSITFGIAYAALFIDLFATLIYDLLRENVPPLLYFIVSKTEVFVWLLGFLIFLKAGLTLLGMQKAEKPFCIISTILLTYVVLDYRENIFIHELVVFIIFVALTLLNLSIFVYIFIKGYKLGAHGEALRFLLFSVAFILIAFGVLLSSILSFETAAVSLFLSGIVYLLLSPPKLFKKHQ